MQCESVGNRSLGAASVMRCFQEGIIRLSKTLEGRSKESYETTEADLMAAHQGAACVQYKPCRSKDEEEEK